jgi:hypothetical protein
VGWVVGSGAAIMEAVMVVVEAVMVVVEMMSIYQYLSPTLRRAVAVLSTPNILPALK